MRTNIPKVTIALLALLLAASPASAAADAFMIDPGHSRVGFKIRHFVSKVPGRFAKYAGTITVDPNDVTSAKISVEIEAASIDTDGDDRDQHLRSADFFDVANHPKITFASTGVVTKGAGKLVMKGDLTLLGVTKPVELDVDVLGFMPDGRGGSRAGFEARATINRKEFGMIWNRALDAGGAVLGDDVELELNIEANYRKPKDPAQAPATPPGPAPAPSNPPPKPQSK